MRQEKDNTRRAIHDYVGSLPEPIKKVIIKTSLRKKLTKQIVLCLKKNVCFGLDLNYFFKLFKNNTGFV